MAMPIFYFMLFGSFGGAYQHLVTFKQVATDLCPAALQGNGVHPATQFWGGYAFGFIGLGNSIGALLFRKSAGARAGFLVSWGVMFWGIAGAWYFNGEALGNKQTNFMVAMDSVLGLMAFIGAYLNRPICDEPIHMGSEQAKKA